MKQILYGRILAQNSRNASKKNMMAIPEKEEEEYKDQIEAMLVDRGFDDIGKLQDG